MKLRWLFLFASLFATAAVFADDKGGQTVSYKSGDETVQGVLYTPAGKGPFPAIVVIHEWWGLSDWVKDQARKLAEEGYVTLAVDLYRGKIAANPEEAHELMRGLPEDRAQRDLLAAVSYLKSINKVKPGKIGAIGWCMGGGLSLMLAEHEPTLAADVVNYGSLSADEATLKPIQAPVLGLFGGQDRGIPPEDVQNFAKHMKSLGKKVDVTIYPNAGHGFQNPTNPNYRTEDATEAWKRIVKFFAGTLKN